MSNEPAPEESPTPRCKGRAHQPITVTVLRSLKPVDLEAWLTDAIHAILDAQQERARGAAKAVGEGAVGGAGS